MKKFTMLLIMLLIFIFASCGKKQFIGEELVDQDLIEDSENIGDTGDTGDTGSDGEMPDNDSEYVDPCNPNPCIEVNKTVCTDKNTDGIAECDCKEGYVLEEDACINSKFVECNQIDVTVPENATIVVEEVEITWEDGSWQKTPKCGWICNENYHTEDGLTCISNTKTVNCTESAPENATDNVVLVEITWDGSWSSPENCEWTCNEAYHTEDGSTCTINFKTVQCGNDFIPPENAEIVVEDVEIIWEDGKWQDIPECGWSCNENYHTEDNLTCGSNTKIVNCTENTPENATDNVVTVQISWDAENGWSDPADCYWECNNDFHTEDNTTCVSNTKEVVCTANPPDNATSALGNVTVSWDGFAWSTPENCTWTCNEGYHTEDGETCISNTKTVNCNDATPDDATSTIIPVDVTWDSVNGWSNPINCEWTCDSGFHTEDNSTCISNIKTVACNQVNIPENSTTIIEPVEITWDEGSGWPIPADCEWECLPEYAFEDDECINIKLVPCDLTGVIIPENGHVVNDEVTVIYIDYEWAAPDKCEWECDACYFPNEAGDNCALQQTVFVDKSAAGSASGKTWGDAITDLSNAIDNSCAGQQIWVAAGIYHPSTCPNIADSECVANTRKLHFTLKTGVAIYGGFNGTEEYLEDRDPVANETILSGDFDENDDEANDTTKDENTYHVFFHNEQDVDSTAVLDGFTITGGNANNIFPHNSGGAMYNHGEAVNPTITNCTFEKNVAESGGAVQSWRSGSAINKCIFKNNFATRKGGAVYNSSSNSTITNCTFYNNSAKAGGAVNNYYSNSTITNCTFVSNSANQIGGDQYNGGAVNNYSSNSTIINCTFESNSSNQIGGAVYNYSSTPNIITITDCTFYNNSADSGGAVHNHFSSPTINNCIFESNSANRNGGAFHNWNSKPKIINCTFNNNSANELGGAFYNGPYTSPIILNSIVWGNTAGNNGRNLYQSTDSSIPEISNSNIGDCGTSEVDWNSTCGNDGGGNIDADPIFIGGDDHPLMISYDSPCRNAGSNDFVTTATDIFGVERIIDETVDMGAYEMPCDVTNPNIVYDYLEEDGYRCE